MKVSVSPIAARAQRLRERMKEIGADYYYVPTTDPHQSEYAPTCWQRRAWISGFTGSAGDALVGNESAYLWTDPRYFLQAEQQLDSSLYQIMRMGQGEVPSLDRWLKEQQKPLVVAVDPRVISINLAERIESALQSVGG